MECLKRSVREELFWSRALTIYGVLAVSLMVGAVAVEFYLTFWR